MIAPPPNASLAGRLSNSQPAWLPAPFQRLAGLFAALLTLFEVFASPTRLRAAETNDTRLVVVVGAPGEPIYSTNFQRQAQAWTQWATRTHTWQLTLGLDGPGTNDLELLRTALAAEATQGTDPLILVLIGHGTFDGQQAKFNLRGPDLSVTNLQQWLAPIQRPVAVVNTASASAPFLKGLARTNRMVISATRSGNEVNATRLGDRLAAALEDPKADLDQDGETSLLEVFLTATAGVAESYKSEGRLATEHPLLEDTGDGLGTPAEWFRGIRATRKPSGGAQADGLRAHQLALVPSSESQSLTPEQRARRDELERTVAQLREGRPAAPNAEYYSRLEEILLELARLLPPPNP